MIYPFIIRFDFVDNDYKHKFMYKIVWQQHSKQVQEVRTQARHSWAVDGAGTHIPQSLLAKGAVPCNTLSSSWITAVRPT